MSLVIAANDSFERQDIRDVELILTAFRTLLLGVVCVAPFVFEAETGFETRQILLMAIAGIYNIAMGVASLFPQRFAVRRPFIVLMDAALITAWMHFSGRWELMSFYFVVVVVAAMWYRVLGGVLVAAGCNFLFLLLWGRAANAAAIASVDDFLRKPPEFTLAMAINVVVLFVVGALAGYIAEAQERERGRRLERELLIANYQQEIDVSSQLQPLLLTRFEPRADLDLGAALQSARGAGGGDYVDALPFGEGKTLLCIADVSGKSVRAQARVPLLKYSLRALAPLHNSPANLMAQLQTTLTPDLQPELYIALCLVVLDSQNGQLTWCNAGHMAPLRVRGDQSTPLDTTAPALGLFPDIAPLEAHLPWQCGDALLLFTDGLADALSFGGAADGEAQVQKLAARLGNRAIPAPEAAQELVDLATSALEDKPFLARHFALGQRFAPQGVRRDDIAVLVARFRE